jgi:hypothetical protein
MDNYTLSNEVEQDIEQAIAAYEADPDAGEPIEKVFADLNKMLLSKFFMKEAV